MLFCCKCSQLPECHRQKQSHHYCQLLFTWLWNIFIIVEFVFILHELIVNTTYPLQEVSTPGCLQLSGPPSLSYDTELGSGQGPPTSLTGVSFAYSTLENALPAILEEVVSLADWRIYILFFLLFDIICTHFLCPSTTGISIK